MPINKVYIGYEVHFLCDICDKNALDDPLNISLSQLTVDMSINKMK